MGSDTKNFRQSAKSQSGARGARDYGKIQRQGGWGKMFNVFKKGNEQKGNKVS